MDSEMVADSLTDLELTVILEELAGPNRVSCIVVETGPGTYKIATPGDVDGFLYSGVYGIGDNSPPEGLRTTSPETEPSPEKLPPPQYANCPHFYLANAQPMTLAALLFTAGPELSDVVSSLGADVSIDGIHERFSTKYTDTYIVSEVNRPTL